MNVMDALCYSWMIGVAYLFVNEFFFWKNSC